MRSPIASGLVACGPFHVIKPGGGSSLWVVFLRPNRWNIRKAPKGTLPPWRDAEPEPEVLAGEDGRVHGYWDARWWVFPPRSGRPTICTSTQRAALAYVRDAIASDSSGCCGGPASPLPGEAGAAGGTGRGDGL